MNYLRIILFFPFSILYGLITFFRNLMFDMGILKSVSFNKPIISVGNLASGGSGKTPMVIYLVDYFISKNKRVGVISRGYNRKSKGFKLVEIDGNPEDYGDEVMMIQNRFPDIKVAVSEKRVIGIKHLLSAFPELDIILLDDAFQHRYVKANCTILLTDFNKPFWKDFVLPSGYLREWRRAAKRADLIVASKVSAIESPEKLESLKSLISNKYDKAFFYSQIKYNELKSLQGQTIGIDNLVDYSVILFSGIDKPKPLYEFISSKVKEVIHLSFPDHHWFSDADIEKMKLVFNQLEADKKLILTSEKDFSRIKNSESEKKFIDLPLYFISIKMKFIDQKSEGEFIKKINDYVR